MNNDHLDEDGVCVDAVVLEEAVDRENNILGFSDNRNGFQELKHVLVPGEVVGLREGQHLEVVGQNAHIDSGHALMARLFDVYENQDHDVDHD